MIKRTRRIHPGYAEHAELDYSTQTKIPLMWQKYQYFYKKGKKQMDCIQFSSHMYQGLDFEIYGIIEDVERFASLEEAESRIEEVMKDKIKR